MQEEKKKYNIQRLLDFTKDIEDIVGGSGVIEYIAITPDEFSIYISHGISMLLISEIQRFDSLFIPDAIFFNENNPQLIIANTRLREATFQSKNIEYLISFVNDCAEFICPCTGSEIHIQNKEIKIFIDQINLLHNEYMGVYNLFDEENLVFKIVLDDSRPYISVMNREDIQ